MLGAILRPVYRIAMVNHRCGFLSLGYNVTYCTLLTFGKTCLSTCCCYSGKCLFGMSLCRDNGRLYKDVATNKALFALGSARLCTGSRYCGDLNLGMSVGRNNILCLYDIATNLTLGSVSKSRLGTCGILTKYDLGFSMHTFSFCTTNVTYKVCIVVISVRKHGDFGTSNDSCTTLVAVLTFSITYLGASRINCRSYALIVSASINYFLLNECFITYATLLTICKTG